MLFSLICTDVEAVVAAFQNNANDGKNDNDNDDNNNDNDDK